MRLQLRRGRGAGRGAPAGAAKESPNLLRNTGFLQCANPGVPDWWGTGAPEQIREWAGCYGTEADAPLKGVRSLRLTNRGGVPGFGVQSYAHTLPSEREYTFSVYLKAQGENVKADLHIGDQHKSFPVAGSWQRCIFTATPGKGHWANGRLIVHFVLQGTGTLWVAAPQLEYGSQATEYRPADADAAKAGAGPAIPATAVRPPSAVCPKTDTPPVLDGKLDDACYKAAARLIGFRDMSSAKLAQVPTECLLARDDNRLYIAFRCTEPEMAGLVAKVTARDAPVFADDSVEIFLQPEPGSADYLHFAVNALGARFDERKYDTTWDAEWEATAARGEGEWTVEIALPFASLGLTPRTAPTWRANFCRNRPHGGASPLSQWSCTYVGYHVPERFGKVAGFPRKDLARHFVEPPKPQVAVEPALAAPAPLSATFELSYYTTEEQARLWVESHLGGPARLELSLSERASVKSVPLPPAGGGAQSAAVEPGSAAYTAFSLASLPVGEYEATLVARGKDGAEMARVQTPLVKLPPAATEVKMHRVNRSLLVNGKPFLVYAQGIHGWKGGWWLEDIAAHGFNSIVAGFPAYRSDEDLAKDEPKLRAFLDECLARGLRVVLWLHPGGGPYPPMREGVVRTITRLKDHPAILFWYLVDEPEGWWAAQEGDKKEADLVDLYHAARAADPYRPAHINWYSWTRGKGGYGSLDATDIGALDRYPVGRGKNAIAETGEIVRLMNDDCRPRRQPTAFWAQMYGYDDAVREPTPDEERGMTYVSLIHGMRLMYYFIYKPMATDLWESMRLLGDELRALEPILTDPDARELAVGVEKSIHYSLLQSRGKLYLIAVNAGDEATEFRLDLRKLMGERPPREARPWFEKGRVRYRSPEMQATMKGNARLVVELE